MSKTQDPRRHLPRTDDLLETPSGKKAEGMVGREGAKAIVRRGIAKVEEQVTAGRIESGRDKLRGAAEAAIEDELLTLDRRRLQHVINATGVMLHTNLGRAPLGRSLFEKGSSVLGGYCNLEIDLETGERGGRGGVLDDLLRLLLGAEAAFAVNNNAAAVLLVLHGLARGREVVVSRGELIQIGGGFRLPDVFETSGARLKEVGTTNITTAEDYRMSQGPETAMFLKAHSSNYRMEGFVSSPSIAELAAIKDPAVLLVHDIGSGWMAYEGLFPDEPTPVRSLAEGADLVTFSGDKLFGGPQAGVIAGRNDLVARLKRSPLHRALRIDKATALGLEETARLHLSARLDDIPLFRMMRVSIEALRKRGARILRKSGLGKGQARILSTQAAVGGGSAPGMGVESVGIEIHLPWSPERTSAFLRSAPISVIGRIRDDKVVLDLRTVLPEEDEEIAGALSRLIDGVSRSET